MYQVPALCLEELPGVSFTLVLPQTICVGFFLNLFVCLVVFPALRIERQALCITDTPALSLLPSILHTSFHNPFHRSKNLIKV